MERMTVSFKESSLGERPFLASDIDKKIIAMGLREVLERSHALNDAEYSSHTEGSSRIDFIKRDNFEILGRYSEKDPDDHWVAVSLISNQGESSRSYAQVGKDHYSMSDPNLLLNNLQEAEVYSLEVMTEDHANIAIDILVKVAALTRL